MRILPLMTTPTVQRIRVTLGLKPKKYLELLVRAHAIYNAMLANAAMFPNPAPTLAVLLVLLTNFDVAQQATTTKAKGTFATRNGKAALLVTGLEGEQNYIQALCDANPELAPELIAGAAMFAAETPVYDKPLLVAKVVPATPGTVHVVANAKQLRAGSRKRPTFHWQSSVDGGKTWLAAQSTPRANTDIANLPLLGDASFRVCVTLGKITGEWSQPVTILVH